ncbi:MAG: trigger factor [Bacilli bacterium]|nr:trigger factor [Bacilli bacterium]
MHSTVKNINETKFEVTCEVDEKVWKDAQEKARKKLYANVEVKGFRKGHVPADIAKKHVNEGEVFNEAINIVLPDTFATAMKDNELRPFTRPEVAVEKFSTSSLTLKFTVVVAPKVTLGKYQGIKIERKKVEVTDKDVDDAIKSLLDQNAELVIKNGEAKKGDTVILDFEGFVDGKPFDGGKANNYELALGSGQFIPGFEDQLIGVKANDKKEVNVTFPKEYVENLKGKNATFKCTIHEVKEKKILELNDETVKGLAIKDVKTVAELKANQKQTIENRKKQEVEQAYYTDLVNAISKDAKVSIADEIVMEEANNMEENLKKQVEQNGLKFDQYLQITGQKVEDLKKKMKQEAEQQLKRFLVLNAISEKEKITVTDDDVKAEYKRFADLYKMDVKKIEEIFSKDLNGLKNQILSRKLHELLTKLNK